QAVFHAGLGTGSAVVDRGLLDVALPAVFDPLQLFVIEWTNHPCWATQHQRTAGDHNVLCDQRAGADEAATADLTVVEQDRAHADDALVTHLSPMERYVVAHRHALAHHGLRQVFGGVDNGPILDRGAGTDDDLAVVATQRGVWPDRRLWSNVDIADDHGAGVNEGPWIDGR